MLTDILGYGTIIVVLAGVVYVISKLLMAGLKGILENDD